LEVKYKPGANYQVWNRKTMELSLRKWLPAWIVLLTACATAPPPPPPDSAFAALNIHSVAVGPVAYLTHQPSDHCSLFIDEDLRSAVLRELRRRGYEASSVGNSVPRSFAAQSYPPSPTGSPQAGPVMLSGVEGRLEVWIDEYWDNSLCGRDGPKYLTMGAEAILYAGSPPVEVWRSRARTAEQGYYSANELIWLTTTRLTDRLLLVFPAGPEWSGQR
jgi:hypothetical protein